MSHRQGRVYLITAPTDPAVTLDEAKAQLRISSNDEDALISSIVDASASQLDPASGGWLGRALRPQTWELRLSGSPVYARDVFDRYDIARGFSWPYCRDNFRCGYPWTIELPFPPLIRIDSVKYDDANGVEQTLVENTDFRVIGDGSLGRSSLLPLYAGTWPSTRADIESFRIRYTSGYPMAPSDLMPAQIKQAVLLMTRQLYALGERNLFVSAENVEGVGSRSYVVTENAQNVMKAASESLLSTLRIVE